MISYYLGKTSLIRWHLSWNWKKVKEADVRCLRGIYSRETSKGQRPWGVWLECRDQWKHEGRWEQKINGELDHTESEGSTVVKNLPVNAGKPGSVPGLGRSLGEGNCNPLQYSCLEKPMDRGAWPATVHRAAKRQTRMSNSTHTQIIMRVDLLALYWWKASGKFWTREWNDLT